MINLTHIPNEFKTEFKIDSSGKAYCSQKGLARLCGVEPSSINRLLGVALRPVAFSEYLATKELQDLGGVALDLEENSRTIPDMVAGLYFPKSQLL